MGNEHSGWLSEGAEVLATLDQEREGWDCDVLIVGSGYGGSAAAATLAGATRADGGRAADIWVLERGDEHRAGQFPSRFSEVPGSVRFSLQDGKPARGNPRGLFDLRIGSDMSVLLGNGLGGGSLINSGVMEKPADSVFATGWPDAIAKHRLVDWYERARFMLGAQALPDAVSLAKWDLLSAIADRAGLTAERCRVTVNFDVEDQFKGPRTLQRCTLCGDCLTGCNVGAKRSLDTTGLATARRLGARLFCGGFVERVAPCRINDVAGWKIFWHLTGAVGGAGDAVQVLHTRNLVLAAGCLGSTEILMRSREAVHGLQFSNQLGAGFSGNGDAIVAGRGHEEAVHAVGNEADDPVTTERRVGPTITGMVRFPAQDAKPAFVLEEFAVPAPLRSVYGEITALLGVLQPAPTGGKDPFAMTGYSIERTSLFGMIVDEATTGCLCLPVDGQRQSLESGIRIDFPGWTAAVPGEKAPVEHAFDRFQDHLQAQPLPLLLLQGLGMTRLPVCTHPLGGCRMADDVQGGVVDAYGRVYDPRAESGLHQGLAVLDAAVLPKALGINPAWTITALALHALPRLADDWGLVLRADPAVPVRPEPVPVDRHRPAPDAKVLWNVRERQVGRLDADDWAGCTATLEMRFDTSTSFRRHLAEAVPLELPISQAQLSLRDAQDQLVAWHAVSGRVYLFERPEPPTDSLPWAFTMRYELVVQQSESLGANQRPPLAVGTRVQGVKRIDPTHDTWEVDQDLRRSPWRELSEMALMFDDRPVGRLALDVGDLVDQGQALLAVTELSSMPDALDDLGAVGLFLLRHFVLPLLESAAGARELLQEQAPDAEQLALLRVPQQVGGIEPVALHLPSGAVLRRYIPPAVGPGSVPVLLVHGLAMSGNGFTHAALGGGLAHALLQEKREVWVLDLRSSIANEAGRRHPDASHWTVETVAQDIPLAFDRIVQELGDAVRVDVFAHCFGGIMFCLASLTDGDRRVAPYVRSAVLSQVGPLLELSPLNRLRGFLAAYVWRQGRVDEFDCVPGRSSLDAVVAALCATFPYPDDDVACHPDPGAGLQLHELVRHRADVIFGQMFRSMNMDAARWQALPALLGWVKASLLAQTIQFARREMLTDAGGYNRALRRGNFTRNFPFPVLMLHGRHNAVFGWRGGLSSLKLLHSLRGLPAENLQPAPDGRVTWYGRGSSAQLAVLEDYGHLDPVVGARAAQEVFPLVTGFLREVDRLGVPAAAVLPGIAPQVERPWVGPMLGSVRHSRPDWCVVRVLVHAAPRRAPHAAMLLVPVRRTAQGIWEPVLQMACELKPSRQRRRVLSLRLDLGRLRQQGIERFAVLTVHADLPLATILRDERQKAWLADTLSLTTEGLADLDARMRVGAASETWLEELGARPSERATRFGHRPRPEHLAALGAWFASEDSSGWQTSACFSLSPGVVAACSRGMGAPIREPVRFALASCQYPPGPLDTGPAMAAYAQLLRACVQPDGPQFLVLTGDQVYVDETAGLFDPDASPSTRWSELRNDIDRIYERAWRWPAPRQTMSHLPVVALMDDHEIRNEFPGLASQAVGGPSAMAVRAAIATAARYQIAMAQAKPLLREHPGHYAWNAGGLPFFLLETRLGRAPRQAGTVAQADMLHPDVIEAMVAWLKRLPSDLPKFIVSSTPLLPPERFREGAVAAERLRSDSWSGFPRSASLLVRAILDHSIHGVVLLAGDSHISSVCSFQFSKNPDLKLFSIVSSGLYTPWPFVNQKPHQVVLDGAVRIGIDGPEGRMDCHALMAQNNHVSIRVVPRAGHEPAKLEVNLHPADGSAPTPVALVFARN